MSELHELWVLIEADLRRACQTLPKDAACHEAVCQYQEFVDNNELELASEMLERYGEKHSVGREIWLSLRDAAVKMEPPLENATRYESRISG